MTEAQLLYRAARARWKQEYTDSLSACVIPSGWSVRLRKAFWRPLVARAPLSRFQAYLQAWRAANAKYAL